MSGTLIVGLVVGVLAWTILWAFIGCYLGYCDARNEIAHSGAGQWIYDREKKVTVFRVNGPDETVDMNFAGRQ